VREKPWVLTDARAWDRWLDVDRGDINKNAYELGSVRNLEFKVIEIGHGIGFGPESNLAG
jgi:hypothetical protein